MFRTRLSSVALLAGLALSSGCMGSHGSRCDSCDPCCERPSLMQRMRSTFRGRGNDCCGEGGPSCSDMCGDGCCGEGPAMGDCCGPTGGGMAGPMMTAPPVAAPPLPGPGPLMPQTAVPPLTAPPQSPRFVPQPQAAPQVFRR